MRIVVLMSTYNGERFIEEQVRSILEQLPADGLLMIRDDGSGDSTVSRIEAFSDPRIRLVCGNNIGFARSFLTLLAAAPPNAEMVMFSDQDDVWLPEKIERARRHLEPLTAQPGLYCSAQLLVNVALRPLQVTPPWPRGPSFSSALSENIVTGCTAALNQPAVALLQSAGVPESVHFHDWWLYLVVSAFGSVVVDNHPTLLYRQHGANVIGHGAGWWGRQMQVLRYLLKHDWAGILLGQVAALRMRYGDRMNSEQSSLLTSNFNFFGQHASARWRLIFGLHRWRQTLVQEITFRCLMALHRLHLWPPPRRRL
jgi:glycosyltransferase involved in cell wall biosynthesis